MGALALAFFFASCTQTTGLMKTTPMEQQEIAWAIQGNLSGAEAFMAANAESDHDKAYLERFRKRFVTRDEGFDLHEIEDPLIRAMVANYRDYWVEALMAPSRLVELDADLENRLVATVKEYGMEADPETIIDIVPGIAEARGYHAVAARTHPLLEFILWKRNHTELRSVELTDGVHDIPLIVMEDFISRGWGHFATLGLASAGGWAKKDGLFCVCDKYDMESEKFKLSFLVHEGRHYVDYGLYPELKGADLEYRAKLSELAEANHTRKFLLRQFTNHAARAENAPHPLANWFVITGLSQELLGQDWPDEETRWSTIPDDEFKAAVARLFEEHDKLLQALGADTAEGVLRR